MVAETDKAPGQTPLDDREAPKLLGLEPGAPMNGEHLREWQAAQDVGLTIDGKWGPESRAVARMYYWPITDVRELDDAELDALATMTAQWESGGRYGAVNTDDEYEGRWTGHPASGSYHVGLSYGIIQFTQDSGSLGDVLQRFYDLDPGGFLEVFGAVCGESGARDMLAVVTRSGSGREYIYGDGGRSVRVRKVCGADLWEEPWLAAFKRAASYPAMQAAQRWKMITSYIRPAAEKALAVGFCGRPEIAVLVDMTTHQGRAGMRRTVDRGLAPHGGRAPNRAAILDVIRAYTSYSDARTNKVRKRRVAMLKRHNPSIGYCQYDA